MKTQNLRINQLSPDAFAWYMHYLTVLDAKDVQGYAVHLADDCEMIFNSEPPVKGRAAIEAALEAYWKSFGTLEHELLNIYGTDRAFMLEALNHYTKADGTSLTLRAVAMTDRGEDGRVTSFRLYTDADKLR